jgi:hypothetical protein
MEKLFSVSYVLKKTTDLKYLPFYETSAENRYLALYKVSEGGMTPPRLRENNKKIRQR